MEIKLNTEDIKKHLVHYYKIIAFGGLLFGIVWLGEHGYNAACVGLMGGGLGLLIKWVIDSEIDW